MKILCGQRFLKLHKRMRAAAAMHVGAKQEALWWRWVRWVANQPRLF